jgi:hypothetical protein
LTGLWCCRLSRPNQFAVNAGLKKETPDRTEDFLGESAYKTLWFSPGQGLNALMCLQTLPHKANLRSYEPCKYTKVFFKQTRKKNNFFCACKLFV